MLEWAKRELDRIPKDDEGMQDLINEQILELVEVFVKQGHSGSTAPYIAHAFNRLAMWKPLTPLTGEDSEWYEPEEYGVDTNTQQNKRCTAVFRDNFDNSTARYIDGKIFSDDGGKSWYSGSGSATPVEFPFTIPDEPEKVITKY